MFKDLRETIDAYKARDPAARTTMEVLLLYPGIKAVCSHRKAHWLYEHNLKFLARLISPIMTAKAVAYLSLIGSVLIFCVGVNLVWGKKVHVANMLPAVIFAVIAAYLPWAF